MAVGACILMFAFLISFSAIYAGSVESYNLHKRGIRRTSARSAGEWWKEWWGKYILEVKDPTIELVVCCRPDVSYPPPVRPPQHRNEYPQPPVPNVKHRTVATQHNPRRISNSQNENGSERLKQSSFVTQRHHAQSQVDRSIQQKPKSLHQIPASREQHTALNNQPPSTQERSYKNYIRITQPEPEAVAQAQPEPNAPNVPQVLPNQQYAPPNNFQQNNYQSSPNAPLNNGPHSAGYQSYQSEPAVNGLNGNRHGMWRPNQPPALRNSANGHGVSHRQNQPNNIPHPGNQVYFPPPPDTSVRKSSDRNQFQNSYNPSSHPEARSNLPSNQFPAEKSLYNNSHANFYQSQQPVRKPPNHSNPSTLQSPVNADVSPNMYSLHAGVQHAPQNQKVSAQRQDVLSRHSYSQNSEISNAFQQNAGQSINGGSLAQAVPSARGSLHNNPLGIDQWVSPTQPSYEDSMHILDPRVARINTNSQKSISSPIQSQIQVNPPHPTSFPPNAQEEACLYSQDGHQHGVQNNARVHQRPSQVRPHPVDVPDTIPHPRLIEKAPHDDKPLNPPRDQFSVQRLQYGNQPTISSPQSGGRTRYPEKSIYYKPPSLSTAGPPSRFPHAGVPPVPPALPLPIDRPPYPGTSRSSHHNQFPNIPVTPTKPIHVIDSINPNEHVYPQTQAPAQDSNTEISHTSSPFVTYPPPVRQPTQFSSHQPATERSIDGHSTVDGSLAPSDPSQNDGDPDCEQEGTPQVVARPDSPLSDGSMPACAVEGKGFCLLTNDYPNDFVNEAVDNSINKVRIMYEELQTVGDPRLFESHDGNSSAAKGDFVCQTQVQFERPGWVKDAISQEWMLVINTDVFPQKIRTESCMNPNQQCSYIAPHYQSSCQQRFSLHRLIALHPNDEKKSPVVTLFKFPAGCSCRVDPIKRNNYVKDYY